MAARCACICLGLSCTRPVTIPTSRLTFNSYFLNQTPGQAIASDVEFVLARAQALAEAAMTPGSRGRRSAAGSAAAPSLLQPSGAPPVTLEHLQRALASLPGGAGGGGGGGGDADALTKADLEATMKNMLVRLHRGKRSLQMDGLCHSFRAHIEASYIATVGSQRLLHHHTPGVPLCAPLPPP